VNAVCGDRVNRIGPTNETRSSVTPVEWPAAESSNITDDVGRRQLVTVDFGVHWTYTFSFS
jgi:hypothetical protein